DRRSRVSLSRVDFFFQAEDGIRDKLVTGVQTCALPISGPRVLTGHELASMNLWVFARDVLTRLEEGFDDFLRNRGGDPTAEWRRSEERRVGKECRWRRG